MILFIRDNECFEPRVKHYLQYFDEHEIDYHVIAWNRNGSAQPNEKYTFYEKSAEYGKRIANIPKKLGWMRFVSKQIRIFKKDCTLIHACDIDAIIPALLTGKRYKKKVVWDIFDWISSLTGKGLVYKMVENLQNWAYKRSDAVILCEEERKAQAKANNENIMVLPNIPAKNTDFDAGTEAKIKEQREKYSLIISYVGVFDRDRGLENLLNAVAKNNSVLLNIAGFGVLQDFISDYANKYRNICLWGRVEYSVGQTIMKNSDLLAAMYYLTSPLHKYAAPNKYYESLALEVPVITTRNTLVGAKVAEYDTGFVIDETENAISELLCCDDLKDQTGIIRTNCRTAWENVYSDYFDLFMHESYLGLITKTEKN